MIQYEDECPYGNQKLLCPRCEMEQQLASAKEEIERRQAHNAMLVEAFRYYQNDCTGHEPSISIFHRMIDDALNATTESTQQLLSEKLAQARKDAISKVCNTRLWTNEMDRVWHQTIPDVPKAFELLGIAANAHSS